MERQIFVMVSNLPDGVRSMNDGGLNGYSGGRRIRPW